MKIVKIKQIIKNMLKDISVPLAKRIIFESNPELTSNVGAVYDEMIKRKINEKYKLVWRVEDKNNYKDYTVKNVGFINYAPANKFEKIKYFLYVWTSKALVFENRMLAKKNKNQIVINLGHGMPIKSAGDYKEHDTCDFVISSGNALNGILSKELDVPIKKFVTLGYPRTDVFAKTTKSILKLGLNKYDGVIVWMPTFRKHKNGTNYNGKQYPSGIPVLNTIEDFEKLNECLKQHNFCIVVKLHPVQDMSLIKIHNDSNVKFLNDADLVKHHTTTYELLANSCAMITDYSSVYYDYLLLNRPIALVIDDITEYEKNRGFAIPKYKDYVKGNYVYSLNDLLIFIDNLARGIDLAGDERKWAKEHWCDFDDFKSTERVTDFILNKIGYK